MGELEDFARATDDMVMDPERKALAAMSFKNEQFYRGLTDEFIKPFPGEKTEDFNLRLKPSANATKRVVNAFLAALYGMEVKRDFESSANQELLASIMRQNGNFQIDASRWHKRAELSGLSYVIPRFDVASEKFSVNHFSAEQVFPIAEPDDPFKLRALVLNFNVVDPMGGRQRKMVVHREVWTPDEFLVMRGEKTAKNANGEELKGSHDFNGIPGSFFKAEDDHENFMSIPPATDARKMHEQLLEMLSTTAEVFRYQSFNILFYKNPNSNELVLGPRKFVATNNPEADLKSVQFTGEIEALFGGIGTFMELIADLGEVPSFQLTNRAGAESGLALSIKFLPHMQAVNRRRICFKQAELKLWADFMRLADMQGVGNPDTSEEALMGTVDFPDVPIPKSIDDETRQQQFDLNNGLTSPSQIVRERNPEMSEKQAIEEVQNNLAETQELLRRRTTPSEVSTAASAEAGLKAGRAAAAEESPASGVEA